jgi:hypothetical protein
MRVRPLVVFAIAAGLMICWLSVRMWFGTRPEVWQASCLLGAWAPFAAAAAFLYVREVGDRESSVGAAWLVRALGMHFFLVWMLGLSDWLRGPPHSVPRWDTDLGGPLLLLSFLPVFGVWLGALSWLRSAARRVRGTVLGPAMPGEGARGAVPFRGLTFVAMAPTGVRAPLAPLLIGGAGCALALQSATVPYWLLGVGGLLLAPLSLRNHRALLPSLAALVALAAAVLSRHGAHDAATRVTLGVAWPWLALAGLVLYLAVLEGLLRLRPVAAR